MKLTKAQIDWIEQERKILDRIYESRPDTATLFQISIKKHTFNLLIELHNAQVEEEKRVKLLKEKHGETN